MLWLLYIFLGKRWHVSTIKLYQVSERLVHISFSVPNRCLMLPNAWSYVAMNQWIYAQNVSFPSARISCKVPWRMKAVGQRRPYVAFNDFASIVLFNINTLYLFNQNCVFVPWSWTHFLTCKFIQVLYVYRIFLYLKTKRITKSRLSVNL